MSYVEENCHPLVTVVVPVYNVGAYVGACLESVVSQTYPYIQIVVVDDGSTDGGGDACDEIASHDVRVEVVHTENCGLSAARNVGIEHAVGEWLLFLDGDDWIEESTVDVLVSEALRTGADVVCCHSCREWCDRTDLPRPAEAKLLTCEDALRELVCGGVIDTTAWGKLYRSGLFRGIRYPEGRVFEDVATTWRLFYASRLVACVTDVLFHYRARQGSIVSVFKPKNLVDFWIAKRETYDALAKMSGEMRRGTVQGCVLAIGRTWCWWITCDRRGREGFAAFIAEMAAFAREHTVEVLREGYPLQTKIFCVACRWRSPVVWALLYVANRLRRLSCKGSMYS